MQLLGTLGTKLGQLGIPCQIRLSDSKSDDELGMGIQYDSKSKGRIGFQLDDHFNFGLKLTRF